MGFSSVPDVRELIGGVPKNGTDRSEFCLLGTGIIYSTY